MTATIAPETTTTIHPIRGALWGLMAGVGLAIVLVVTKVIYLDLTVMLIVVGACLVVGVLWGSLGPPKPPTGPAPLPVDTPPPPPPTSALDGSTTDGAVPDSTHTDIAATAPTGDADATTSFADPPARDDRPSA